MGDLVALPIGDWRDGAACQGHNPDLWFPEPAGSSARYRTDTDALYALARTICVSCPVADGCLEHAVSTPEKVGMWAGRTPGELVQLRRARRLAGAQR